MIPGSGSTAKVAHYHVPTGEKDVPARGEKDEVDLDSGA